MKIFESAIFAARQRRNSCDIRSESMVVAERVSAAQKINRKMATVGARTRCVRTHTQNTHMRLKNAPA